MIDKNLFFGILFSLATFYVAIGLWTAQKVRTLKEYFLADRNLGIFKLTFTLVATQLGSGLLLGTAERAYHLGIWGILYTIGMSLGFLILGCGLASRMRSLNIATTAEIFESHYSSQTLKLFASALSIFSLWGILVAQIIASKKLFFSLGLDDPYTLGAFWCFLIFYTMLGGLESVVIVDAIQVIFIITVFSSLFYTISPAAFFSHFTSLSTTQTNFTQTISCTSLLPTLMIPTFFSLIEQDLAQRFFAAKTKATATISALLASIIIIAFSCIPLILGMGAKITNITIPAGGEPLMTVIATFSSKTLLVLAVCGIIAAITSTADSLLSAISSNIVQDFGSFLPMDRQKLFISRLVSFMTGCAALTASFFVTGDIISVLESSYRISVICLFVPTIIAYFSNNLYKKAAYASIACGITGFMISKLWIESLILKDIVPLACSLIGYIIMHITEKNNVK